MKSSLGYFQVDLDKLFEENDVSSAHTYNSTKVECVYDGLYDAIKSGKIIVFKKGKKIFKNTSGSATINSSNFKYDLLQTTNLAIQGNGTDESSVLYPFIGVLFNFAGTVLFIGFSIDNGVLYMCNSAITVE